MPLRTCNHLHDTGERCNSAAAVNRDDCVFHLRYRARLLRMAQTRARNERFDLKLPPLEDMFAVQSALNQLVEAVAADMLDLKHADFLLKSLRFAAQALKSSDKWQPSVYHTDQAAPAIDLAAEYGLPEDLDLNTPPEVAFPESVLPSEERSDESKDPYVSAHRAGAGAFPDLSPMPSSGGYCSEHGWDCPDLVIRADHPVTPEMVEVREVADTLGADAAARRGNQLERNRQRRELRSNRKRFADLAMQHNIRIAAEKLAQQKLAAEKAAAQAANVEPASTKKPPAAAGSDDQSAQQEAKKTA